MLAERLSELGQRLLAKAQEGQTNPLIVSLFVRGLQSLQGAILLAERGLATEAAIITRSVLETMFYLGALRRDDTFAEELRQDHIKRLSKNAQEFLKLVERDGQAEDHEQLKDDLKVLRDREGPGQEIAVLRVADRAERRADYDTSYRHLSTSAVHTTVKALGQHWHEDGSGYGIRTGPALPHLIEDVKGTHTCDDWWEPETEWHRGWKNQFPESWQEVHHKAADGERHVADVKTELGYIEFQHSPLKPDERRSREDFYPNLVWVVDGRRRAQDRAQFFASIDGRISDSPPIFPILPNKCALLRDWLVSGVPVYFDFGDSEPGDTWRFKEPLLWLLAPCRPNGKPYLVSVRKTWFLRVHNEGRPAEGLYTKKVERVVADYLSRQAFPQGHAARHRDSG